MSGAFQRVIPAGLEPDGLRKPDGVVGGKTWEMKTVGAIREDLRRLEQAYPWSPDASAVDGEVSGMTMRWL